MTSQAPPPDTRQRILRATLQLISEGGVGAISNRKVATAAGVSLGSLTYHFPSQTALLRESLLMHVGEEVGRLRAIAAEFRNSRRDAGEVAEEIERIAAASSDRLRQIAELELHLYAARDPQLQEASRRCFAAYDDFAEAALEALSVPASPTNARAVVAMMTGLAVRRVGAGEHEATGTAEALRTLVRGAGASL